MRSVGDIKLLARAVSGIDIKDLSSLADEGKKQVGSGVVAIVGTTDDGKAGVVVGVTADLTGRFNAVDLVRKGAEALGGKGGGGRPDMAQAGGPDGSKADDALKAIEAALGAGLIERNDPSLRWPAILVGHAFERQDMARKGRAAQRSEAAGLRDARTGQPRRPDQHRWSIG